MEHLPPYPPGPLGASQMEIQTFSQVETDDNVNTEVKLGSLLGFLYLNC